MLLDSSETKQRILDEFLKICAFDGWNKYTLLKALAACQIDEKFCDLIFENGCLDLAQFYAEEQNKKSAQKLAAMADFESKKIRDKIRLALYARFEVEKNNQIAIQRLINFYLNPKNLIAFETGFRPAAQGLKACYKIADFIWKEINDQSTDFNYYTKRLTLAKIIWRSLAVFVKDQSHDFAETKNFIDSEIEKVMKFEKLKIQAKKIVGEVFLSENGSIKSPKEIVKNLPFFRLIKFK